MPDLSDWSVRGRFYCWWWRANVKWKCRSVSCLGDIIKYECNQDRCHFYTSCYRPHKETSSLRGQPWSVRRNLSVPAATKVTVSRQYDEQWHSSVWQEEQLLPQLHRDICNRMKRMLRGIWVTFGQNGRKSRRKSVDDTFIQHDWNSICRRSTGEQHLFDWHRNGRTNFVSRRYLGDGECFRVLKLSFAFKWTSPGYMERITASYLHSKEVIL